MFINLEQKLRKGLIKKLEKALASEKTFEYEKNEIREALAKANYWNLTISETRLLREKILGNGDIHNVTPWNMHWGDDLFYSWRELEKMRKKLLDKVKE
jgi:hypothetical protein